MGLVDKVHKSAYQDFDQHMRTCISMISGSGFGCKAELGAGGVHLLCLLRRLLRHQPTAVHWESVQGESCSCANKWQRGYYPVRKDNNHLSALSGALNVTMRHCWSVAAFFLFEVSALVTSSWWQSSSKQSSLQQSSWVMQAYSTNFSLLRIFCAQKFWVKTTQITQLVTAYPRHVIFNTNLVNIIALIFIVTEVNLGHNATVCDNLTKFPETQIESQKLVAGVQVDHFLTCKPKSNCKPPKVWKGG